jgi:quercetin dioxygenase-like cupin family protein
LSYEVRRVVTGHDAAGLAVVRSDERVASREAAPGYEPVEIWATTEFPVRNEEDAPPGQGPQSHIRIGHLAPGHRSPMHRTHTIDYAILLAGECELHLDGGEVVHLRAGDVVVQRGTNHAWVNASDEPARFAFVLLDAEPLVFDGVELPDTMPPGVHPD